MDVYCQYDCLQRAEESWELSILQNIRQTETTGASSQDTLHCLSNRKIRELLQEMGPFATSLSLDLPRNLPSAPTLDWLLPLLLPTCKTLESLTIIGGIFKTKIQSQSMPQCVRKLSLKDFGSTSTFLNSICVNFPCLERLNLTFDMKHIFNNKGISIAMPNNRLNQIMIEPKNYGYRLPRKSAFIAYLKIASQSKPLRYCYNHVSDQNAQGRPNTGRLNTVTAEVFKIKVEVGDL